MGAVDELWAHVAMAIAACADVGNGLDPPLLLEIQAQLMDVGSWLAAPRGVDDAAPGDAGGDAARRRAAREGLVLSTAPNSTALPIPSTQRSY